MRFKRLANDNHHYVIISEQDTPNARYVTSTVLGPHACAEVTVLGTVLGVFRIDIKATLTKVVEADLMAVEQ